jgi:hypothetical protein
MGRILVDPKIRLKTDRRITYYSTGKRPAPGLYRCLILFGWEPLQKALAAGGYCENRNWLNRDRRTGLA